MGINHCRVHIVLIFKNSSCKELALVYLDNDFKKKVKKNCKEEKRFNLKITCFVWLFLIKCYLQWKYLVTINNNFVKSSSTSLLQRLLYYLTTFVSFITCNSILHKLSQTQNTISQQKLSPPKAINILIK